MSGWSASSKFPTAHVFMTSGGVYAVRGYRKRPVPVIKSRLTEAQRALTAQFKRIHRELRVTLFAAEGLAIFFEPVLEKARLRLVRSNRGGPTGRGRWDIWHPQHHRVFLSERRKRQDALIKHLRGVIVTESGLFELDAMNWESAYSFSDVVFKRGAIIDTGDR